MWGANSCCTISLPAKMMLKKLKICSSCSMLLWVVVVLSLQQLVLCQDVGDYNEYNSSLLPLITQVVNRGISTLTSVHSRDINKRTSFCVTNPDADWNQAFNFSSNPDFFAACIKKTKGDAMLRLCTAAEVKFYFDSLLQQSTRANYLNPNKNCNLTSWPSGCEPGWSCRVGNGQPVDLRDSKDIPERKNSCQPCCEGFFCPHGITCMIPCPLGSFCPLATLNNKTGVCEPYNYQVPPGQPNHTCGAANIWADVGSSNDIFCSAGSYCPTTVQKRPCNRGHYCRMGSTSQRRCFKVTSCHANATHENIHAYGVMLIVALSALLLIMYYCYDQALTAREKRLAKSREAGARIARELAKAPQKLKDSAKAHFSRTFSRRKSVTHPQQLGNLNQPKSDIDAHLDSPTESSVSRTPSPSSTPLKGKRKEPRHVMQTVHEIEEEPDVYEGVSHETADLNAEGHVPEGRNLSTRSQMYLHAYAQIEEGKRVSVATNTDFKKRPPIEISFEKLTLTLKGKNKDVLRCVTGKIRPQRITAVMGPSGAGKTTFLSALAGKAIGCKRTGLIHINGKNESIHSYKKIVGFVPQDDIVHGNLTVEENLWFSARCRLAANLRKLDKVLIVERAIESLGLQTVRNSLVGTVEKRGISGGQRKRVNIGLELVMEPSLLFLDEPTSGLDSGSSQLLLRALRREALEGVNICMVVHQPSYSLFIMFDDLVLLAKGGLVVYHGPVEKVEEYFSGLGINVPERVNPPDHYIDVLEGMVMPSASSGVNYEELPVRWMLHNGYPVPQDMLKISVEPVKRLGDMHSSHASSSAGSGMEDGSLSGEKLTRETPGVLRQYKYFLGRICKQRMREIELQAIDYLILLLAGASLGALATANDQTFGAAGFTYTIIAVSLLCKIAALRSFSLEKLQYWRESASGMSSLAYFLAKDTIDHFHTAIKPVVYLFMFYFFTNPRSTFVDNYVVLLCLVYCVTGIAYALAIFLEPGPAQLCSVLLPVVLTLISTRPGNGGTMKYIAYLCYPRWALEALVIANAERYYGVWLITRCGLLLKSGYNLHHWGLCLSILFCIGVFSRIVAFTLMVTFQRR